MAGGIGRGLGAYDEMVWRSMVRDDSYFCDVVGLESEGTAIDFQTGDQLVPLRYAVHDLPRLRPRAREADRVDRAPAGIEGLLLEPVQARLRRVAGRGVAQLDRVRARLADARTSSRSARTRSPRRATSRRSRWARSRAPSSTMNAGKAYVGGPLPGPGRASRRASTSRPARSRRSRSSRGRRSSTSLRSRSTETNTVFWLTTDNNEWRDLWRLDLDDRQAGAGRERPARRGPRVQPRRSVAVGSAARRTARRFWLHVAPSLRQLAARSTPSRTAPISTTSTCRPTAATSPAAWPRSTDRRAWSLFRIEDLLAGKVAPEKLFDFDESLAAELHVLARRQEPLRLVLLLGCLERLSLRPREARDVRALQRRDRPLPAAAALGRRAARVPLQRRRVRPGRDPQPATSRR